MRVVLARGDALIPEAVEMQHLETGRAHLESEDGSRHDAAELPRELGAVGLRGGRVSRARLHVGVVR